MDCIGAVLSGRELAEIQRIAADKELTGATSHVEGLHRMRQGQARMAKAMIAASNYCAKGTWAATLVAILAAAKIMSISLWDSAQEQRTETAANAGRAIAAISASGVPVPRQAGGEKQ